VHFRAGRILVEDDGPGLPPEELPLIFERHWRCRLRDEQPASAKPSADAQHATSSGLPEPGSLFNSMHEARGLGLAIARQMAEYQGWQMHAEALQPHGLRFVISPAAVLHPSASLTEI
jgi:signal transduction histidine kinase